MLPESPRALSRLPILRRSVPHALLVVAIVIGVVLRYGMLGHGIWRDEASTFFDAFGGTWQSVIVRVAHSELNPPGYFLFMHFWMQMLPVSDQLLKLPSLLASVALIPLGACIGWRLGGQWVGIIAAWIMALAPMDIYYAQEARPYMFAAFFTLVGVLGLCELIDAPKAKRGLVLLGIGMIGSALTQYTGEIFAVLLLSAWGYARSRRWMSSSLAPVALVGLMLVIVVAWLLPDLLQQMHAGLSWEKGSSFLHYPEVGLRDLFVTLPLDWLPNHEKMKLLFIVLIILDYVFEARSFTLRALRVPGGRKGGLLLGMLVVIAVLEIPISNHGRYMVAFSPLAWLCIAVWLLRGFCENVRRVQIGAVVASVFLGILFIADVQVLAKDRALPKSGAARLTTASNVSVLGDIKTWSARWTRVLVIPDYLAPTVAYYLREHPPIIYGFARWDQPQNFSPLGYAALWNDPQALSKAMQRVAALRASGVQRLILLSMPVDSSAALPYGKGSSFVTMLKARYPVRRHLRLMGTTESLTVDELLLLQHFSH